MDQLRRAYTFLRYIDPEHRKTFRSILDQQLKSLKERKHNLHTVRPKVVGAGTKDGPIRGNTANVIIVDDVCDTEPDLSKLSGGGLQFFPPGSKKSDAV